jgi:hypothetical protein
MKGFGPLLIIVLKSEDALAQDGFGVNIQRGQPLVMQASAVDFDLVEPGRMGGQMDRLGVGIETLGRLGGGMGSPST